MLRSANRGSVHVPWYCWRRAQGDNLEVYWCFWEWLSLPSGLPLLARELWKKVCCKERTPWRGEERSLANLRGVRISPAQCCCCRHRRRGCYSRRLEATTEGREDIQVARERACNPFPFSVMIHNTVIHKSRLRKQGQVCGCLSRNPRSKASPAYFEHRRCPRSTLLHFCAVRLDYCPPRHQVNVNHTPHLSSEVRSLAVVKCHKRSRQLMMRDEDARTPRERGGCVEAGYVTFVLFFYEKIFFVSLLLSLTFFEDTYKVHGVCSHIAMTSKY